VLRNVITRLEAIYGPSIEGGLSTSHRGWIHFLTWNISDIHFVAIDRAEQMVGFADGRQENLLASVFDQASPPNSVCPLGSSGKRKQIAAEDIEGTLVFLSIIDIVWGLTLTRTRIRCSETLDSEGKTS
jgi:hypothetical protein